MCDTSSHILVALRLYVATVLVLRHCYSLGSVFDSLVMLILNFFYQVGKK